MKKLLLIVLVGCVVACSGGGPPFPDEPVGETVTLPPETAKTISDQSGGAFKVDAPLTLATAWILHGEGMERERRYEAALYCYQQSIKVLKDGGMKDNPAAYLKLVPVFLRLRKPELAIRYADFFEKVAPGKRSPLYLAAERAVAYDQLKQYDQAAKESERLPMDYDQLNRQVIMGTKGQTSSKDVERLSALSTLARGSIAHHRGDAQKGLEDLKRGWADLGGNGGNAGPDLVLIFDELPEDTQEVIRGFDREAPSKR